MTADLRMPPGARKKPGSAAPQEAVNWYAPGPVSRAFLLDEAFIDGIMGPFGSGKSVTCVMKLLRNAKLQMSIRGPNGWAYRRTVIIRNTYPELRTTTMPTFFAWIPKEKGKWRDAGPPMFHVIDAENKFDWEVYFIALDRPDDLKKLLGMELSDVWINEAREVPKAILDGLTGRVGRYPAMWQGGCVNAQILMDTNPPDTDHWWFVLAEQDTTSERNRQVISSMHEAEELLRVKGFLRRDQPLFKFYRQPSGRSPQAENLRNLRPGYYEFQMAGKSEDWIKVYIDGEYGFVMDGKPVYPEYRDSFHSGTEFAVLKMLGFRIGFDFGLTPAATISQRTADGRWLVQDELTTERMGIPTFAKELMRMLREKYPGMKIISARGDPAGDESESDGVETCFKMLKAAGFLTASPAPTNDPVRRREGVRYLLKTVIDGVPAIRVNPRCTFLRKGLSGGFHYRRLQIAGEERYRDVPEKDMHSHVCEAFEYDVVSAGEDRNVTTIPESMMQGRVIQQTADNQYDIFGG